MADKMKVIAVTTIHRTVKEGVRANKEKGIRAVPPQQQVIQPGTVFQTKDKAEFDELFTAGAIRVPEKDEKAEVDVNTVVEEDDKPAAPKGSQRGRNTSSPSSNAPDAGGEGSEGDGSGLV